MDADSHLRRLSWRRKLAPQIRLATRALLAVRGGIRGVRDMLNCFRYEDFGTEYLESKERQNADMPEM